MLSDTLNLSATRDQRRLVVLTAAQPIDQCHHRNTLTPRRNDCGGGSLAAQQPRIRTPMDGGAANVQPEPTPQRAASHNKRWRRRIFHCASAKKSAFTLLEVLLAAGLSLVLLSAILSAVTTYRDVSVAGRQRVARAQLARAILRQIELDVRSTSPLQEPAAEETEETGSGDSPAEATAGSTEVTAVDTVASIATQSGGVFGDAATLVVHGMQPQRTAMTMSPSVGGFVALAGSDLKSIAYFLAEPGSGGLPGISGDLLEASGQSVPALARLEGQRLTLAYAEATADVDTLAGMVRVLADEIATIQFRYFDGVSWYESWDSASEARLPNAIEVTLGFRDLNSAPTLLGQPNEAIRNSQIYRYVIALPIAEPATPASSSTFF